MSLISKLATAGAVAVMAVGMGAASASAVTYDLTGGHYTGTSTAQHTFTVGGVYTISCDATFTGDTEVPGGPSTDFTPSYNNCVFDVLGVNAQVTINEPWTLTVTSHSGSTFYGDITIPASSDSAKHSVTIDMEGLDCKVHVDGHQVFQDGDVVGGDTTSLFADQVGSDIELNAEVFGIDYTVEGQDCPFTDGSDGYYSTNGPVEIPGVTVDVLP